MNKIFYISLVIVVSQILFSCSKVDPVSVLSPDKNISFTLLSQSKTPEMKGIPFSLHFGDQEVILPSHIRIVSEEIDFSGGFFISKVEETSVENEWVNNFGERKIVPDNYRQIKVFLESSSAKINIIARAYNEGVAFAYEIPAQAKLETIRIHDELITYNFSEDFPVWSTPRREKGVLTAQGEYRRIPLSKLEEGCERPLVVEISDDLTIALTEARLVDYARLSFNTGPDTGYCIQSSLDGRMTTVIQNKVTGALESDWSDSVKVIQTLPFQSPWRVVMMAESHGRLLENSYLILNLNDPSEIEDESWILPGKALREATLTTEGAYVAINFVAAHNMQYVHFDAGWYGHEMDDHSDATTVTLDPKRSKGPFDIEAVSVYAKKKDVKIMLYVNRRALEKQLDELLPLLKEWGVAGIKYGFVRVGDQDATAWLHEAIKKAAAYELIVDVHDEYRPTGFSRTYPNLLTQEGIRGDETTVTNQHSLITMFTRMLAGAADNTICYYNSRVEKMGSHASQLAKAVCFFSPLQFLYWYDRAPAAPLKSGALWGDTRHIGDEPELEFFDAVPTTWDETKVLLSEIGEIGVIARRNGDAWFIGGINGETARTVDLDFSFLPAGVRYTARIYTDDEGTQTRTRVKIETKELDKESLLSLDIEPNNGFAMQLKSTAL